MAILSAYKPVSLTISRLDTVLVGTNSPIVLSNIGRAEVSLDTLTESIFLNRTHHVPWIYRDVRGEKRARWYVLKRDSIVLASVSFKSCSAIPLAWPRRNNSSSDFKSPAS